MKHYWKHLKYTLRHKFWVGWYLFQEGHFWQALTHDWTKFLPIEFIPYARHFFEPDGTAIKHHAKDESGYYDPFDHSDEPFKRAIWHHFRSNKHHWQFWTISKDFGTGVYALEIPRRYVIEMICDFKGAGKAHGTSDITNWWNKNNHKLVLHPKTRKKIAEIMNRGVRVG